jgi:DNA-directed RNA polymerase subunit RPC12/RpoP
MSKEIKEKILEKLEGKRKLRCPFCECSRFKRFMVSFCDIVDDGEGVADDDISEEDYSYECSGCGKDLDEEELK